MEPGTVVHTENSSTWEVETEIRHQDHSCLYSELEPLTPGIRFPVAYMLPKADEWDIFMYVINGISISERN